MENKTNHVEPKDKIVKLIVGGKKFTTTLETLTKDKDSMLAAMFSGKFPLLKDDKGYHYIDRDGAHFRYILNYLRDGTVDLMKSPYKQKQLLREAEFYQLDGLVTRIKAELLRSDTRTNSKYAVVYLNANCRGNLTPKNRNSQNPVRRESEIEDVDCGVLNQLAGQGYQVEGFAGNHPAFYALIRKPLI